LPCCQLIMYRIFGRCFYIFTAKYWHTSWYFVWMFTRCFQHRQPWSLVLSGQGVRLNNHSCTSCYLFDLLRNITFKIICPWKLSTSVYPSAIHHFPQEKCVTQQVAMTEQTSWAEKRSLSQLIAAIQHVKVCRLLFKWSLKMLK
jgi:hypothetical protein